MYASVWHTKSFYPTLSIFHTFLVLPSIEKNSVRTRSLSPPWCQMYTAYLLISRYLLSLLLSLFHYKLPAGIGEGSGKSLRILYFTVYFGGWSSVMWRHVKQEFEECIALPSVYVLYFCASAVNEQGFDKYVLALAPCMFTFPSDSEKPVRLTLL